MAQPAPATAQSAAQVANDAAVARILGTPTAQWTFNTPATPSTVKGVPVITSGATHLVLSGTKDYGPNMEYTVVFRFGRENNVNGGIMFGAGQKQTGNMDPLRLGGLTMCSNEKTVVGYLYQPLSDNGYKNINYYNVKSIMARSLGWPEALRKSVESEAAAQPLVPDKWLTLRFVTRPGSMEMYLDDRFVGRRNEPGLDVTGKLMIQLYPGTDLRSFTARPLSPGFERFRPVGLKGYLNAGSINGQALAGDALGATRNVGGVPFEFAGVDGRGHDHIALAKSWAQFGALEGYFESTYGDFNGRWPDPFYGNPARIALRLPADAYTGLHLIAASDDAPNSVPIVTAQFYKDLSGYPENFAARVPLFSRRAANVTAVPVKLANGKTGSLYHITIPLDPARLAKVATGEGLSVELTKEVKLYRGYPDPCTFSYHQAGLPSGVHIYAATMERAAIAADFTPDQFGHVWTAPALPSYTVKLRNRDAVPRQVELTLTTLSHDRKTRTSRSQIVSVPPGDKDMAVPFKLGDLEKYGYHDVTLTVRDGKQTSVIERSLAFLHTDTRVKGNWAPGQGPSLGYWGWGGGHDTPNANQEMTVMAAAGAETMLGALGASWIPQDMRDLAAKHSIVTYDAFTAHAAYATTFTNAEMKDKFDPTNHEKTGAVLIEELRKIESKPSTVNKLEFITFFPEPGIGPYSYGSLPEYYGEPEHQLTPAEQKNYQYYKDRFLIGAKAVRKAWPNVKILLPYGDPLFAVPYLRDPETRPYIDGSALDMPGFERMPESQLHQVVHHRLYELLNEYKTQKPEMTPYLCVVEGTCADTPPGALTFEEQSDIYTRNFLIYFAYGIYLHPSGPTPFDCGNYWGEEHYGCCGLFTRLPMAAPKPSYVAYATLTRHLNRAMFTKWLPTGSLSAYCLQFKHVKDGHLVHSLYTIRGKRPVTLKVAPGDKVTYYDQDDNAVELPVNNGTVSFTLTSSPCYIEGLSAGPQIALGEPDHTDSVANTVTTKLGNLGAGAWQISTQRDSAYEDNNPLQIVRFPGKFTVAAQAAPAVAGGKALAVKLGAQDKERKVMPWYSTIVPPKPITIAGKASHLGLWVRGNSDWGRVVYSLRDASGQVWRSVGTADSWNCDDAKTLSFFNFDGWRYVRFELPSNEGYDNYRNNGSTWWGHSGGDGVVHLPLALEKIIVERRTHAIYVNDPQPANPGDVLLGDLFAEYENAFDKTAAAVARTRVRMPIPEGTPELENPITGMTATGVGASTAITHVDPPPREADGTRGLVHFTPVAGAQSYDIWVSPYQNGSGAMKLAADWKESGGLLTGLHADVDFYLFLVYKDKDGKESKPSAPFKIRLKDNFAMK